MFQRRIAIAKASALSVVMILLISFVSSTAVQSQDNEPSAVYSVYLTADTRLADSDIIESYEAFALARLTDAQVLEFRSQGVEVVKEDHLNTISLTGFTFNTDGELPEVPGFLRIGEPSNGTVASYLLQFIGPIKRDWVEELETRNVHVQDYIHHNAFIVRMRPEVKDEVSGLPFVNWVGFYEPMYRIEPSLWSMTRDTEVEVILFKDQSDSEVASLLGDRVIERFEDSEFNVVEAIIDVSILPDLAKLSGVYFIEPEFENILFNKNAQAVYQTNKTTDDPEARRIWDMGIDGKGQVITIADTGLDYDHAMFRESNEFPWIGDLYNVTDMSRRKLVRYMVMRQVDPFGDPWAWKDSAHTYIMGNITSGHGTSVAAAAVGEDGGLGMSPNDGMAKGAKMIVQDIGTVCRNPIHDNWWDDCLSYVPQNYTDLFLPAYENGSRIHSNSWGSTNSNYDREARSVDYFMWNYPDMVILFANGNGGPCSEGWIHRTGSPATAKDVLSIGMNEGYGNQHNVTCWSSTGPTDDGRRKPTTLAFGSGTSAWSTGDPFDEFNISSEGWFGGSSYATPLTAGMAAMVRQYFEDGWYPLGVPEPGNSLNPTSALVKAMLVASAQELKGNSSDMTNDGQYPNNSQGWGRPLLDDVMYFAGDRRKLIAYDNQTVDYTGHQVNYSFTVRSSVEPLRISLVWTDYPASLLSPIKAVNDLDLVVTDPHGNEYKGNVLWSYSDPTPGESKPNSGTHDHLNPVEGVIVKLPMTGEWKIRITGTNIPKGPQPFALVVNGAVKPAAFVPPVAAPTNVWAELEGVSHQNIRISWDLSTDDPGLVDHYAIYYSTDYSVEGAEYRYLTSVPAGSNSFVHAGVGNGHPKTFYYYVQSNGTSNETGRSEQQVGKYLRYLGPGMQLVSFPLEQRIESVQTVLQTVWDSFDMLRVYENGWKSLWRVKDYGDVQTLSHEQAFWIHMTSSDYFVVAGRVLDNATIQLEAGWNFVGYPSLRNQTASDSLFFVSYVRLEGFSDNDPYHLQEMQWNHTISTGYGYWIYVAADQTWTVYNF